MKKLVLPSLVSAAAMAASLYSVAESQGSVGATSTGSVEITLTLDDLISVKGLNDLTLEQSNSYADTTEFCVGRFGSATTYQVTLSSSHALKAGDTYGGNQFQLSDGTSTEYVGYQVFFDDDTDSNTAAVEATVSGNALGASFGNMGALNCDDDGSPAATATAQILVQVPAAELTNASIIGGSSFTDTLTVTVTAQ